MPNPNPVQSQAFLDRQKPKIGEQALAKPIPVRFPVEIDAVLRDSDLVPDRQELIRDAVVQRLKELGLLE